jgi:hypothetical protein
MGIARRMLLRLEEGIEVPERTVHVAVGFHLCEAHLEEDLAELGSRLQKRVEVASRGSNAESSEVVFLERLPAPRAAKVI